MPLSRRRAFAGKLYERETGGTANVYLAAEELRGRQTDVIFKLRDGEVTEEEREGTRLVDAVGSRCGLVRPILALEWVAEVERARARAPARLRACASTRPCPASGGDSRSWYRAEWDGCQ